MPDQLQVLAGLARAANDNALHRARSVAGEVDQGAYEAVMRLRDAVVVEVGDVGLADRILAHWLIIRVPIHESIAAVRAEPPGGWPEPKWGLGAPSARGRTGHRPVRYEP